VLEGHIVPNITMEPLIGIQILCKMGCIVVFTDTVCYVSFKSNVILTGYKDPSTDLWVLPITPDAINQEKLWTSQGHDSVSPRANKILLCHHVEHAVVPAWATALAQEQLSTYAA
jgi:hypothetical protein